MNFEESLVVFSFCLISVARLKESPVLQHGVGGPLLWGWGDGWLSNGILVVFVVGGAAAAFRRGRATLERRQELREYDVTKGFPGEDVILRYS